MNLIRREVLTSKRDKHIRVNDEARFLFFCQGTRHELHPKVLEVIAGSHLTIFLSSKESAKEIPGVYRGFHKASSCLRKARGSRTS